MMASLALAVAGQAGVDPVAVADLAGRLALPLAGQPIAPHFTHLLTLTPQRLELHSLGPGAPGPLYADFVAGEVAHRHRHGGGRNQALARAIGLRGTATPSVVDATAGLGRDGFVIAALGGRVRLIERSPVIAALLADGLERAARDAAIGPLIDERLRLTVADARAYLRALPETERPDVVYLDPMYPHRRKTALSDKAMRLLRLVAGDDDDAPELLTAALACARRRVTVKRPRLAPSLAGPSPGFQIVTRNTRFDIYPSH